MVVKKYKNKKSWKTVKIRKKVKRNIKWANPTTRGKAAV